MSTFQHAINMTQYYVKKPWQLTDVDWIICRKAKHKCVNVLNPTTAPLLEILELVNEGKYFQA